jgi:hypothetical protein
VPIAKSKLFLNFLNGLRLKKLFSVLFWWQKSTEKNQRQKGVFAYFASLHYAKSAKPLLQPVVFCKVKKLLPSLRSVGWLSATYACFGVAGRKFSFCFSKSEKIK